jgi:hypothetical protein
MLNRPKIFDAVSTKVVLLLFSYSLSIAHHFLKEKLIMPSISWVYLIPGKNGPGKNGRGADWLCRWPARAGTGEGLTGCDGGQGGLGTGESLQVLCVLFIERKNEASPEAGRTVEGFFFHFSLFPNVFSRCSL